MNTINSIKIIFLIFSFFIIESFELEVKPRVLEYRDLETDNTNGTEYNPEPNKPKPSLIGYGNYLAKENDSKFTFTVYITNLANGLNNYTYVYFTLKINFKESSGYDNDYGEFKVKGIIDKYASNDQYIVYNVEVDTKEKFGDNIYTNSISKIISKNDIKLSFDEYSVTDIDYGDIHDDGTIVPIGINDNIMEATTNAVLSERAYFYVQNLINSTYTNHEHKLYGYIKCLDEVKREFKSGDFELNYPDGFYYGIIKSTLEKSDDNNYKYYIKIRLIQI